MGLIFFCFFEKFFVPILTSGGYVGLSIATLLSQHHKVIAVDIVPEKVELMDMYKWIIPNEYGDESSVQQDLNLHYVGLTRAKDACYIMNGTARFRSKKNDYIFAEPSSFLSKPGLAERRKDVRWEM